MASLQTWQVALVIGAASLGMRHLNHKKTPKSGNGERCIEQDKQEL